MRAVTPSGRTRNVAGSGIATMSDSSIALKPVIDEPSKPMPSSSAPSTSPVVIEKLFRCPSRSVNQRSTSSIPSSFICFSTDFRAPGSDVARFLLSTCAISPPHWTARTGLVRPWTRSVYWGRGATLEAMVESFLAGLATTVSKRRRAVVLIWVSLIAAGGWFSLHQNDHLSGGGWEVPGSASIRVADEVKSNFPAANAPAFTVFIQGGDTRARLAEVRRLVAGDQTVLAGRAVMVDHGRAALLPLAYVGATSNAIDEATSLRHRLVDANTNVVGEPAIWSNFEGVAKQQLARGEAIGFPLILLILLAAFGTVVAAVAPLALGFASVFLTGAVIYFLSQFLEISVYVTNMASMIGIGVAVDYSLFIVSRFRRELHEGAAKEEALRRAMSSSGTAVVFSGAPGAGSLVALYSID